MPSVFSALENRLFEACESVFGEEFEHRPYVAAPGGGRRSPDSGRTGRIVIAIFQAPNFKSTEFGSEARGSLPATMERTSLAIDIRQFAAGPLPERFDRFLRTSNGDVYEATQTQRDAEGRLTVSVQLLGRE